MAQTTLPDSKRVTVLQALERLQMIQDAALGLPHEEEVLFLYAVFGYLAAQVENPVPETRAMFHHCLQLFKVKAKLEAHNTKEATIQ